MREGERKDGNDEGRGEGGTGGDSRAAKKEICLRPPAGREEKRAQLAAVDRGGRELRVVGTAAEQQQRGYGR